MRMRLVGVAELDRPQTIAPHMLVEGEITSRSVVFGFCLEPGISVCVGQFYPSQSCPIHSQPLPARIGGCEPQLK